MEFFAADLASCFPPEGEAFPFWGEDSTLVEGFFCVGDESTGVAAELTPPPPSPGLASDRNSKQNAKERMRNTSCTSLILGLLGWESPQSCSWIVL